tara:strand:+ start:2459 stop:2728 length:270 start_codon:yes stop_codon:yes gene_type:complete
MELIFETTEQGILETKVDLDGNKNEVIHHGRADQLVHLQNRLLQNAAQGSVEKVTLLDGTVLNAPFVFDEVKVNDPEAIEAGSADAETV